jgi:exodeoxyribonuclease VII large subunit
MPGEMPDSQVLGSQAQPLTVTELTNLLRDVVSTVFAEVWVVGEAANVKRHQNGHLYFSLRDAGGPLPAVLWQSRAVRLVFDLQDGMEVICRGKLDVYPPHGKYQLVVTEILPRGRGPLEVAFQQLKEELQKRGWFDAARKKPLPRFPRRIGLVTSPTGAVIRDMVRIIRRRWPLVELILCPVSVQGERAAGEIAAAIRLLNRLNCVDVMIVGRGGGSLEDLQPFNERPVAEAIYESRIPVISAVGHETDFTIADFVADLRAATPSEAAEKVVPDRKEYLERLARLGKALHSRFASRWRQAAERLRILARRRVFRSPLSLVTDREQRLDEWSERLLRAGQTYLDKQQQRLAALAARLEGLSPLKVLARGYSLTYDQATGAVVRQADQVAVGDLLRTRLAAGELFSRVEAVAASPAVHAPEADATPPTSSSRPGDSP